MERELGAEGARWRALPARTGLGGIPRRDGRAREPRVQIGQRNDREAQVIEGLSEGQTVILHPPDTLNDDARVRVR